jgi:hypothetical protein
MKKTYLVTAVAGLLALCFAATALALEPTAMKESVSGPGGAGVPCPLAANTNGTAANLKWYNLCSGYIWLFSAWGPGDQIGVHFDDAAVNDGNDIKRTITYFRNILPNYGQLVDIFVDLDNNEDGCPEGNLLSDIGMDPGLRWNCSEFNADIPAGTNGLVVRARHYGGPSPTFVTDGARQERCLGPSPAHSWYYGTDGSQCLSWIGPDGTNDNWVFWLILDTEEPCINATESKSWGAVKGLYR